MSPPDFDRVDGLTVYYDASCPLCVTEMRALQTYAGQTRLRLVDCSAADFDDPDVALAGLTRLDLTACIHAQGSDGQWLRGVDVFERAYRIAGLESVARACRNHWLRPLLDRAYPRIARNRMLLSRFYLDAAFAWLIARVARRAQQRSRSCQVDGCNLRSGRS
jgi:predicted DCC family thiol-disulfide oxidoreductase YuxK